MLCSIRHSFYQIKSETYALNGNISILKNEILIERALDKFEMLNQLKEIKTLFKAPKELMNILTDWKIEQKATKAVWNQTE